VFVLWSVLLKANFQYRIQRRNGDATWRTESCLNSLMAPREADGTAHDERPRTSLGVGLGERCEGGLKLGRRKARPSLEQTHKLGQDWLP